MGRGKKDVPGTGLSNVGRQEKSVVWLGYKIILRIMENKTEVRSNLEMAKSKGARDQDLENLGYCPSSAAPFRDSVFIFN